MLSDGYQQINQTLYGGKMSNFDNIANNINSRINIWAVLGDKINLGKGINSNILWKIKVQY